MDITKLAGEELASMLAEQYELLIRTQQNLRVLNIELERRKKQVKPDEPEKEGKT